MVELNGWNSIKVPQRLETGCIPTGYEWLIQYLNIQGVRLETFQEDVDLGTENSFVSVSNKIMTLYHHINSFQIETFIKGIDKVNRLKFLLQNQIPCLISLSLGDNKNWHIMPVVKVSKSSVKMIHHAYKKRNYCWNFPIETVVWKHENLKGGKDISWIEL